MSNPIVNWKEEKQIKEFYDNNKWLGKPEYCSDGVYFLDSSLGIYPVEMYIPNRPKKWGISVTYTPPTTHLTEGYCEEPEWKDLARVPSLEEALSVVLTFKNHVKK